MTGPVADSEQFGGGDYAVLLRQGRDERRTSCGPRTASPTPATDWDLAAIPSYNGTITSPLNADTFAILKDTKNPDAAFAA